MTRRNPVFLAFGALLLASAAVPFAEELLKSADHEALGKQLREYVTAVAKNEGSDKAIEKVNDELAKFRKKTGKDPLSLTSDLGKALWASYDYDKAVSKLKKGAIKDMTCPKPLHEEDAKATIGYALWIPTKYEARKPYPLLLIVPDKAQKARDHLTEKWIDPALREGAVIAVVQMPEGDSTDNWTEMATAEKDGGLSNVLAVFGDVRKVVAIDYDRVYVVGWGEGVRTAVTLGARFPDRFAGVAGRSGDPTKDLAIEPYRNLPTFFAGAGENATKFSERISAAKYDNCTVKADAKEAEIWAWIQDHPRIANPAEVVYAAAPQVGGRFYWLQLSPFDEQVTVKANVDKGTNTILIDGEGATDVTLYFNDLLVDLEKDVKVVCNGTEHIEKIPRNLSMTLGLIGRGTSDPGKLYVAQRKFDLPPKPKPKTSK